MNQTQRQSAALILASEYKASGANMEHIGLLLTAGERGDAVACRALAADCMRVAQALEGKGDARTLCCWRWPRSSATRRSRPKRNKPHRALEPVQHPAGARAPRLPTFF